MARHPYCQVHLKGRTYRPGRTFGHHGDIHNIDEPGGFIMDGDYFISSGLCPVIWKLTAKYVMTLTVHRVSALLWQLVARTDDGNRVCLCVAKTLVECCEKMEDILDEGVKSGHIALRMHVLNNGEDE